MPSHNVPLDRVVSLGVRTSSFPRVGMATQVQDREHRHQLCVDGEEHAVGKITDQGTPNAVLDDWKLERILQKPGEGRIDLRFEAETEALTLALVPKRRLEDFELGFGRNVESPLLANGAEARQQLLGAMKVWWT